MLTEKDKNIILNKLIESFNNTGVIDDLCFGSLNWDEDNDFKTSVTVGFYTSDIIYDNKNYSLFISTPDFCSKNEIKGIPNDFDINYIINNSYVEIYNINEKIAHYELYNLPNELTEKFYERIKYLITEYNENI